MILKHMDSKGNQIAELERLIAIAPADRKPKIELELRLLRAGIKAEQDAGYYIDFDFKASPRVMVIHDLRLEVNNRVAQIDHLLINRSLHVFVLETKCFHASVRINEQGEFLFWNEYKKAHEGIPSPFAQNDRHISVLKDAFDQIEMPSRLGISLSPTFQSFILIAPNADIVRPRRFDTSRVIKADMLLKNYDKYLDEISILDVVGSLSRLVSEETVKEIGHKLISLHKPASFNYATKFGLSRNTRTKGQPEVMQSPTQSSTNCATPSASKLRCRNCNSENISIRYGKFGYYFKCLSCDGNTPINITCDKHGHKERVHKDGCKFYRECTVCKTWSLFFVNPAIS